jgi:putative ABC transport system permease protein
MIKNYFKTAWRNLVRNKSYAAINIVGLAIGIAACLLIFVLVSFETSFDNFHPNKEKIYRVVSVSHSSDGVNIQGSVPLPTA